MYYCRTIVSSLEDGHSNAKISRLQPASVAGIMKSPRKPSPLIADSSGWDNPFAQQLRKQTEEFINSSGTSKSTISSKIRPCGWLVGLF